MANRLKTISYCFANTGPVIVALNTAMTIARTLYIPESTKVFKDVTLTGAAKSGTGAVASMQTRSLSIQVGSNTATTVNNAIRHTESGEHTAALFKQDLTAQFTSFWGANVSSHTCNATMQINGIVASAVQHNAGMEAHITYSFNDDVALSPTRIKSVMIPLDCPVSTITTTNTTYGTVPALDTYLPEASKTYRDAYIVIQGNRSTGANANLHVLVGYDVKDTGALDTNNLDSQVFYRRYVNCQALIANSNTSVAHNFQLGASVASYHHQQAWMVVTYEYNEASTTRIMNSLKLPMDLYSPAGSNATTYLRETREFWIQEPGTITTNRVAFYSFWNQATAVGTPAMRIGTGSFVNYTDTAAALGGSNAAMTRKDDAFVLARGRNTLNYDVYRTDTAIADMMWNMCGFWLVNYTSDKPTQGSDAANKTIQTCSKGYGTAASVSNTIFTWNGATFPETEYYLSAVGSEIVYVANTTGAVTGFTVRVEKTAAEGGVEWMPVYKDNCITDVETGTLMNYSQMRSNFKRFDGDLDSSRVDIKDARRFEIYTPSAAGWLSLDIMYTYHGITYNVSGTTANCAGGNVQLRLHRTNNGELLATQNVAANASYNFVWHDNTEPVFVVAEADGGKYARTPDGYAEP
jgi:hypothetical protein